MVSFAKAGGDLQAMSVDYYDHHAEEFFKGTVKVDVADLHNASSLFKPGASILMPAADRGEMLRTQEAGLSDYSFLTHAEMVRTVTAFSGLEVQWYRRWT